MKKAISVSAIMYFLLILLCLLVPFLIEADSNYFFCFVFSFVLLVETILLLRMIKKENGYFLSFATIFYLVLLVFNFGQVFLLGLFPSFLIEKKVVLKFFLEKDLLSALRWINCSYVLMGIGILLGCKSRIRIKELSNSSSSISPEFEKKALFLFLISFPLKLYIDFNFFIRAIMVGFEFGKQWLNSFPNFLVSIGNFSLIGVACFIVSLQNKPKKQLAVFIVAVSYILFLMLGGRRSENVSYICILAFVFELSRISNESKKKMGLVTWIAIIVVGYFGLTFLYTVVHLRNTTGKTLSEFFEGYKYYIVSENIITEEVREYGQTGFTAICVILNWLPKFGPSIGTSYYRGIVSVLPNIGGIGAISLSSNFGITIASTPGILDSRYLNIGGSIIGEAFFNFGIFGGIVFLFLIGHIIGRISYAVNNSLQNKTSAFMFHLPMMFSMLYWVRDYFGDSIREMVWGLLICLLLSKVSLNGRNHGKKQTKNSYSN